MEMFKALNELDWQRERSREYPAVEIPFGQSSIQLEAGDGNIANIRGWTLTFGFVGGEPSEGQRIVASLSLRYPQKGNVEYVVEDFDATQGGVVFIPWPRVSLRFRDDRGDTNTEDKLRRSDTKKELPSRVVVSFVPALADENVPPGIRSIAYGRSQTRLDPSDSKKREPIIKIPKGATAYRVHVSFESEASGNTGVVVKESSQGRVWTRYTVLDQPLQLLVQSALETWQQTPPEPGGEIKFEPQGEAQPATITVLWQYDLGGYR